MPKLLTLAWPVALVALGGAALVVAGDGRPRAARHRPAANALAGQAPARAPMVNRGNLPTPSRPVDPSPPRAIPAPAPQPQPPPQYMGAPAPTGLQLQLVATVVTKDPAFSSAIITDQTQRSAAYFVGDALPGAGKIIVIAPRYIDFEHGGGGQRERLEIAGAGDLAPHPAPIAPPTAPRKAATNPDDPLAVEMDTALKQTSPTSWEIARSFVDHVLADPMMLMKSARIMPGKEGLSVFAVKPGGAADRVGLKNGDKIVAVNGNELAGAGVDQLLQLYAKLKTASHLTVRVSRGGQVMNLDYVVR